MPVPVPGTGTGEGEASLLIGMPGEGEAGLDRAAHIRSTVLLFCTTAQDMFTKQPDSSVDPAKILEQFHSKLLPPLHNMCM